MARMIRWLVAGFVGLALAGMLATPAAAVSSQPVRGADACPAPAAWSAVPSWSGSWIPVPVGPTNVGTVDPGVGFQSTDDEDPVVPEHQLGRCEAPRMSDPAPGLDDGLGSLLWRGPDWGVPSLGTFA